MASRERRIFPFDATIMNANKDTTIETIAFIIPGFVFSCIVLAVTEFSLMHPQLPRQQQIDNYVQALVHLLVGFLAHICIQQLSSVLVRILRVTSMPCVLLWQKHISNDDDS